MEDKNELSDIVLEKDGDKILKTKRVLIIIAILIIIFLGVLLSMKLLNKPMHNDVSALILPPEPTSSMEKSVKDQELFKQVPIIEQNNTKKDNFENMVKNLKEKELATAKTNEKNVTTEASKQAKKVATVKTIVEPVVKPIKSTIKKMSKKIPTKNLSKATKGIYIQVGATSKYTPNKKFLKLISDKKYSYKLLSISINGKKVTKILIGPFKDSKDAKNNINSIRKSINKNAFIYRVK